MLVYVSSIYSKKDIKFEPFITGLWPFKGPIFEKKWQKPTLNGAKKYFIAIFCFNVLIGILGI